MPATRIETRRGWVGARRAELLQAVQRALVEGIRIPEDDRNIRLVEYEKDCFLVPPDAGEGFLSIEVTLIAGRTLEAKRRLYAALVREMAAFGVEPRDVRVILIEPPAQNWGVSGRPASEVDLGFAIEV
ncbi:tautomerase family protein [Aureimonas sp. AU4]|uniref:tautomerase family protein n=1 Tax=Aureimonas sp. AU4 TaxID=1638163 RepID=UPI000706BE82|nr:tautomerase family protein [Aureimonas sp. AU4]BAT30308.1 hypothetical protein [Aureimonas sp. AU4]